MGSNENRYIKKARRKRMIKRIVFIMILVIIAGGLFVTKSNVFLIKKVNVTGGDLITKDIINEKVKQIKEQNIFFVKSSEVEKLLKSDPYVDKSTIKRKLPSTLEVNVTEKNVGYYVKIGDNYDIISSDLVLLEKVNKLKTEDLIQITGLNGTNNKLGEAYVNTKGDKRLEDFLVNLYEIKKANKTDNKITMVNVANINKIKIYFKDVEVKVGNGENLVKKMRTALSILEDKKLNLKNGYIDLSFDGTPVINEKK
ncbi:cell division protein FtsQ/DivIB [Eubacterium multiforme]|uniref:Cell division protein FtsQ n=1 Tax=Eubacterium multiforme TaxID=83339 RepID=A0ABT9USL6_9FIRM|nr:FtsQ-type POTRA domain-containing protein [Eubacterium multiforme]MDQ0149295.1 cell division protein FtsQ [Eubacterium multiforme]